MIERLLSRQRPALRRRPPIGLRWIVAGTAAAAAVAILVGVAGRAAGTWWGARAGGAVGPAFAVAAFRTEEDGRLDAVLLADIRAEEATIEVKVVPAARAVVYQGRSRPLRDVFAEGGAEAAAGALAPVLGRPLDAFISGGPNALARFIDAIGGIPLPVRDDLTYEAGGAKIVVPAGAPRYDGDKVEEYLGYPWRDPAAPGRAVTMGCLRRLSDLAASEVSLGELWRALSEEWEGDVPPETFAWAAGVARTVGATGLTFTRLPEAGR